MDEINNQKQSITDRIIRFCLENKLIVGLLVILFIGWGLMVAPFDWDLRGLPRNPVSVDAIPDIGENQQIVFTEWMGRSPRDVEDQVTYPLTVSLLGVPGVKTIRSYSFFGFSGIFVIFNENIDFYWSRSRIFEKLNSLPANTLPEGVKPSLGPDATALGQIFWYTLEGYDDKNRPTGGWDSQELRTIQDWQVRYSLLGAEGVSEVASIGGKVKEYQIDVDPDAMRAFNTGIDEIYKAVKSSNIDVGAKTIEINKVEYVIRGLGFIKDISDIENTVVKVNDNVPVYIKDIAEVSYGPALRRGALDKGGAEAVGGVVVVRHGFNPLEAINNVKKKIEEISTGLPKKTLSDGTVSQVKIVPFYDRTGLIYETLGTLNSALTEEVLVTMIVVILLVFHFRSSLLICALLPLAILMCFIAMKLFGVDANIVALSGIAIAIGTMVDMGIVICENILKHLKQAGYEENKLEVIYKAASEVGSAVLTAVSTTVVGFLPVFALTGAEGKLFKPLAYTKTFALISSVIVALTIIPPAAYILFTRKNIKKFSQNKKLGSSKGNFIIRKIKNSIPVFANIIVVILVSILLTNHWRPLGITSGMIKNLLFVTLLIGSLLVFFIIFQRLYPYILGWCLNHKLLFLSVPLLILILGGMIWIGFGKVLFFAPQSIRNNNLWAAGNKTFPGLGKEFMPSLDEGSFLYMPTTMPHASIEECLDILQKQDAAIQSIPEIESVVGKIGRVDSPLDPAPISMIETIINYKPEYITDENGNQIRQWRENIESPDDIWDEIVKVAQIPGTTSAPKLQPIAARIVMLQSGMRAPMGIKVKGPDLDVIEYFGLELEKLLKEVPSVKESAVIADRIVGKPYLEIEINRQAIARYGISIAHIQEVIEVAIGGKNITTTVEGRERYSVRVRYQREERDHIETLGEILIPSSDGSQIPLIQLAEIRYVRGPQAIKSEDTFLVGYVLFDKKDSFAEVDVVDNCREYLENKIKSGELIVPAGVSYSFAGSYENQVRAQKKLAVVIPLALFIIFIILYMQFRSVPVGIFVFSGILVAWAGGFMMIWFYSQPWFLDFQIFSVNMRELFQVHPVNLSVAVWVGFLALFGIASDDGVVMCTYIKQSFQKTSPVSRDQTRELIIEAGKRRIRPCLMTTATTILALIPILTSTGRGSDIMVPMAIPSFGGMTIEILTMLIVPTLYCALKEFQIKKVY
ncbi:MAG: efflux RND transporter permease subunit [Sedimentisphaerales bacterium]|nr:efflux RND transporter permease subunit [Sedimentisphaerales bacterium]